MVFFPLRGREKWEKGEHQTSKTYLVALASCSFRSISQVGFALGFSKQRLLEAGMVRGEQGITYIEQRAINQGQFKPKQGAVVSFGAFVLKLFISPSESP